MVDNMTMGQVFLRVVRFSSVNIISPGLHNHFHLEDEQQVRWWPQFRDTVSTPRHEQQQQGDRQSVNPISFVIAYLILDYVVSLSVAKSLTVLFRKH
jgi:hypothetical protein